MRIARPRRLLLAAALAAACPGLYAAEKFPTAPVRFIANNIKAE